MESLQEDNHKSYKPSKRFLVRGGITAVTILLILVLQTNWFANLIAKKAPSSDTATGFAPDETLGSLVNKDSNGNNILDWEEKLWGLDPKVQFTNGVSNKQIIEEKKANLGIIDTKQLSMNETDLLAQQLFSISSAVGQSGQASDGMLTNIGTDIGGSIKFKQVSNHYSSSDIKTTKTTTSSLRAYYNAVGNLTREYKNETTAIDVLIPALETGDFTNLQKLKETSAQYISFAKSLQTIVVPVGIANEHLSMLNGFYGMAQSFEYILQIEENGINGIAGIAIYKNYSAKVDLALSSLNDYFINYGIINE